MNVVSAPDLVLVRRRALVEVNAVGGRVALPPLIARIDSQDLHRRSLPAVGTRGNKSADPGDAGPWPRRPPEG
ncbi:hypothetical protein Ae505Ps2_1961 [Pseudonocardia sp. Ae505_Ps2]|nr:hypothetical protein Ae505Ps2_1961 [Pseudonocardia sp. Ae505_Ps2]